MALSVERHNPGISRSGRGMASRSSFSDPRSGTGVSKDFRGDRKWINEGPTGGRNPLWKKALGLTEWSKEQRKRSKIAVKEFRNKTSEFERRKLEEEREWNKRGLPEFKKDVYYKWGVPSAQATAERYKDDPRYQEQYQNRLAYAEKELKKYLEKRTKDLQQEKYNTRRELEAQLKGRRQEESKSMLDEWHSRR